MVGCGDGDVECGEAVVGNVGQEFPCGCDDGMLIGEAVQKGFIPMRLAGEEGEGVFEVGDGGVGHAVSFRVGKK